MIISLKMSLLITQLLVAVVYDLYCYKVKNEISFVFILVGLFYNLFAYRQDSLITSILGLIIPFVLLFPLYMLNMLGAGDIKLFCSLGSLIGIDRILDCIAHSYIFGLFIALFLMVVRRNFYARLKQIFIYFKSCYLTMSILPYDELGKDCDAKLHFTIPIALGTLSVCLKQI